MNTISSPRRQYRSPVGLLPRLRAAVALYRQRRDLARLSSAQLEDIGLTRTQAQIEARRAPWDAPSHWYE